MSKPIPAINRYKADLRELQLPALRAVQARASCSARRRSKPGARTRSGTSLAECYRWVQRGHRPAQRGRRRRGLQARGRQGQHARPASRTRGRSSTRRAGSRSASTPSTAAPARRARCRSSSRRCSRAPTPRSRMYAGLAYGAAEVIEQLRHARAEERSTASACSAASGAARCASPSRRPAPTSARRAPRRRATPTAATSSAAPRSSSPAAITISPRTSSTSCSRASTARRPGTKGLTLFIVPKIRVDADGKLGEANDVAVGDIEHKMGINGSATCILNFGENGDVHRLARRRRRQAEPGHAADVQDDERRAHRRRHAGRRAWRRART